MKADKDSVTIALMTERGLAIIWDLSYLGIPDFRARQKTREFGALHNVPAGHHVDIQFAVVLLFSSL